MDPDETPRYAASHQDPNCLQRVEMDANQRGSSKVAQMIWIVGSPIIFTVGVIGNIVTIIVLMKRLNRTTSTAIFLTSLAWADLMIIVCLLPRWWIIYTFGYDIRRASNIVCKVHWFLVYFLTSFSAMMLLIVTVERIICTTKPYKVKVWCNKRTALRISVSVAFCLFCLMSHIFYGFSLDVDLIQEAVSEISTMNASKESSIANNATELFNQSAPIVSINKQYMCLWSRDHAYKKFYTTQFPWIVTVMYNILPQTVFFIGGITIIKTLARSKYIHGRNRTTSVTSRSMGKIRSHSTQITITMLSVNAVFFLCTTPVQIYLWGRVYWIDFENGMNELQETLWAIFNLMFYLNHAINFVLYFLSGMRFRSEVMELFRCRKRIIPDHEFATNNIVSISKQENIDDSSYSYTKEFMDALDSYVD